MRLRNRQNQARGQSFERLLAFMAERNGVTAVPNGQRVRWLPGGRTVAVKCNLDWTLLFARRAAFVDTKSFAGAHFTLSQIDPRQLALAVRYSQQGFLAGFVAHLRASGLVAFVPAMEIAARGARSRFMGMALGTPNNFDLRRIFESAAGPPNAAG